MAAYAPAFGMLGTVLGLIVMMNKFQMGGEVSIVEFSVNKIYRIQLEWDCTTNYFLWSFISEYDVFTIAGKLKRMSENELMLKSIVLEGIISIHGREHPILIREKLMTFVSLSERNKHNDKTD